MGYSITMKTGNMQGAGTDGTVKVRFLRGDSGLTNWFTLDKSDYNDFEQGDQDTYAMDTSVELLDTDFIQVNLDPSGIAPDWYLEWIRIVQDSTKKTWKVSANVWFQREVDVPVQDGNATVAGITDRLFKLEPAPSSNPNIYWSSFDGNTWSLAQPIPQAVTDDTPALAASDDTIYLAWKGNGNQSISWSYSTDGSTWQPRQKGPGDTQAGPALACSSTSVYQTWRGSGNEQSIWWSTLANSSSAWQAQQQNRVGQTRVGLAVANLNDSIYMAWRGRDDNQQIWWSSSTDGSTWQAEQQVPSATTPVSPVLASFNSTIYLAWKSSSDQQVWWAALSEGSWSSPQKVPDATTDVSPALASFNDRLYAAWKSASDQSVWWATFDGNSWSSPQQNTNIATGLGPALASFKGRLYLVGNPVDTQPAETPYMRWFPI